MSVVIDRIKAKHEDALAVFVKAAEASHTCAELNERGRAITNAKQAFAELLKYHKQFKAAVGVAAKIERTT